MSHIPSCIVACLAVVLATPALAAPAADALALENTAPWVSVRGPTAHAPTVWTAIATDPEGDEDLRYHWDFGDGVVATTAKAEHAYARAGDYEVTLTVFDSAGAMTVVLKAVQAEGSAVAAR
ncbi:MAG: PKD domain-containing protein [Deltaproteobacteria bacterium]|nr:PKD domain-containing protein [Deltaproteobacteria bacterium]